jgi:hypothetical protein
MKAVIARATMVVLIAFGGASAAWGSDDCGNTPCPEKSSSKEPASRNTDDTPAPPRAGSAASGTQVKARQPEATPAKATLAGSGITAKDLKMPPKVPCSVNSPHPCANEEAAPARTDVQGQGSDPDGQ